MPEEPIVAESQINQPPSKQVLNIEPKKPSKKIIWVLLSLLILVLIGVGVWVLISKPFGWPSKETEKQATSSAKTETEKPEEAKPESTKFAYTGSDGNIWVLDVVTKGKIQVTTDGSQSHYYSVGKFIDSDTFSYEICNGSNCEIWLVDLEQNQFKKSQLKKIPVNSPIYAIDPELKALVYSPAQYTEVTIVNLKSSKPDKKLTYDLAEVGGRGGSGLDCFKIDLSPDSSKFFLVNTLDLEMAKIIVWDLSGNKLGEIKGKLTTPFWINNTTILYRNWDEGIFTYNLVNNEKTKLNNNKDWTLVDISSDRKKLSHNMGNTFQMMNGLDGDRSIYLYNLETKEDKLIKSSAVGGAWVGDDYLVGRKTKKCAANDPDGNCSCEAGVECYTAVEDTFVVINLQTNASYEVAQ